MEGITPAPGDVLVTHTDSITEWADAHREEFCESRLTENLHAHFHLPAHSLLQTIEPAVQGFSEGDETDGITLLAAKCRFS